MRKWIITCAVIALLLCPIALRADSTFGWSAPGQTGTLWYDAIVISNSAYSGGATVDVLVVSGTLTVEGVADLNADSTCTNLALDDGATLNANNGTVNITNSTASFEGSTISDLGAVTTADINGGTVDSAAIGGSTPAAGAFTTLNSTGTVTIGTATVVPTSATELTITETTIDLVGALVVDGVTASGAIDATGYTSDAGAGLDVQAVGTLMLGAATATKVEVGKSGVETEVQGDLDVQESAFLNGDTTIAASQDLLMITDAGTATNILASNGALGAAFLAGNIAVARIATALTTPGAIGGSTPSTGAFTTLNSTGTVTIGTATIVPTSSTTVTVTETTIDLVGALLVDGVTASGEITVGGKYAVVGPDAATGLMIDRGTCTNGQATVSFNGTFGVAPSVVIGWVDDVSGYGATTNTAIAATSVGTTTFVPKTIVAIGSGLTDMQWIAVGTRP